MTNNDFCENDPLPCEKNLGIKRINMPQINNPSDLKKLKHLVKTKLHMKYKHQSLNVSKLKKHIFASQKEINISRAMDIALNMKGSVVNKTNKTNKTNKKNKTKSRPRPKIPVILLHSSKTNQYLVVDGHHRWLAYYLYGTSKHRMKSLVLEINDSVHNTIEDAFRELNEILLKDTRTFHKRHRFT